MYTIHIMKKIFIVIMIVASLFSGGLVFGANPTPGNVQVSPSGVTPGNIQVDGTTGLSANAQLQNPFKYNTFSEFAAGVTKTAVKVLLPFVVLAFIYSGFLFVKAQGNEAELENAKKAIWYSIIGAFILLGSWGFANIIGATVGALTV